MTQSNTIYCIYWYEKVKEYDFIMYSITLYGRLLKIIPLFIWIIVCYQKIQINNGIIVIRKSDYNMGYY